MFAVLVSFRAVSHVEQIDTDTNEPVAIALQSLTRLSPSPVSHEEELEVDRLHPSVAQPSTPVYLKFTPDFELLEQLSQAVAEYRQNKRLSSAQLGARPVPIIVLAPLSEQGRIRSLVVRETYSHVNAYITMPIKIRQLYETLNKAWQESCPDHVADKESQTLSKAPVTRAASGDSTELDPSSIDRVLIVEDNPVNRKVLQRMLARFGFSDAQLPLAENGQIALDFVYSYIESIQKQHKDSSSTDDSVRLIPPAVQQGPVTVSNSSIAAHELVQRKPLVILMDLLCLSWMDWRRVEQSDRAN